MACSFLFVGIEGCCAILNFGPHRLNLGVNPSPHDTEIELYRYLKVLLKILPDSLYCRPINAVTLLNEPVLIS
jgi:hypothetical protein